MALPAARKNFPIVVAIDIGTARSGWAYAIRSHTNEIYEPMKSKEATALLLDGSSLEVMAFGDAAKQEYLDLPSEAKKKVLFFENFKMALYAKSERSDKKHGDENNLSEISISAANGLIMKAEAIFTPLLRHYVQVVLAHLQRASAADSLKLTYDDIQWVITVPALWGNVAKQFMRETAKRAGMWTNVNPLQLIIALESECGSLACYKNDLKFVNALKKKDVDGAFAPGVKYLVVDLGGGTADFTMHLVTQNQVLGEVVQSSGGPWGSINIDKKFVELLEKIVSKSKLDVYKINHPGDWLEVMQTIQHIKQSFTISLPKSQKVCLPKRLMVPETFVEMAGGELALQQLTDAFAKGCIPNEEKEKMVSKPVLSTLPVLNTTEEKLLPTLPVLDTTEDDWERPVVTSKSHSLPNEEKANIVSSPPPPAAGVIAYRMREFKISHELILSLFQPVVSQIMSHMQTLILAGEGPSYIYFVGGFSDSEVIREAAKTALAKMSAPYQKIKLIFPANGSTAIIQGAVYYGLDPAILHTRVAKFSYGVEVCREWDGVARPEAEWTKRRYQKDGKTWQNGYFHKLVTQGEHISLGKVAKGVFHAVHPSDGKYSINLYCADAINPIRVTDPTCTLCGYLEVTYPIGASSTSYVDFVFASTEIMATVKMEYSGAITTVPVKFLQ